MYVEICVSSMTTAIHVLDVVADGRRSGTGAATRASAPSTRSGCLTRP